MATLSISFTIADDKVVGIKDDFSSYLGWTSTVPDPNNPGQTIPNPESQNAFIKRNIGEYVKNCVKARRVNVVADLARASEISKADSEIILS